MGGKGLKGDYGDGWIGWLVDVGIVLWDGLLRARVCGGGMRRVCLGLRERWVRRGRGRGLGVWELAMAVGVIRGSDVSD